MKFDRENVVVAAAAAAAEEEGEAANKCRNKARRIRNNS